jgi:two-component system cell cycle response regulator DivK
MGAMAEPCGCVLLVEDNEDSQVIYRLVLEHYGYCVLSARNGAEAIEVAQQHLPDLILMDISIPIIDGWEATRRLKSDSRTAEIPIVALTAHALSTDRERAAAVGCDGYLTKPAEPRRVLQAIRDLLTRRSAQGEISS